jgi:hypothetical protein
MIILQGLNGINKLNGVNQIFFFFQEQYKDSIILKKQKKKKELALESYFIFLFFSKQQNNLITLKIKLSFRTRVLLSFRFFLNNKIINLFLKFKN